MNSPLVCPNMCRWLDDIQRQTFTVSPPAGQVKLLRQRIISFGHHTCMADWEESRKGRSRKGRSFKLDYMTNLHHFQLACVSQIKRKQKCVTRFPENQLLQSLTPQNPPSCTSFCCVKCKRTVITLPLRLSAEGWGWNLPFPVSWWKPAVVRRMGAPRGEWQLNRCWETGFVWQGWNIMSRIWVLVKSHSKNLQGFSFFPKWWYRF